MAKVILRQEAINDLNAIWDYTFEEWSESQADKYYSTLKLDCMQIGENPKIGKVYDWIKKNLLGLRSGRPIIFYQPIAKDEIEIIRILHEQMDVERRIKE